MVYFSILCFMKKKRGTFLSMCASCCEGKFDKVFECERQTFLIYFSLDLKCVWSSKRHRICCTWSLMRKLCKRSSKDWLLNNYEYIQYIQKNLDFTLSKTTFLFWKSPLETNPCHQRCLLEKVWQEKVFLYSVWLLRCVITTSRSLAKVISC